MLWIVALFVCVTIHELAHCLVARARGAHVTDILLLPFGGFSRIDELDKNPVNERDIAAAGPLASLALGGIFLGIALLLGSKAFPPTVYTGSWWARLGWMNLILAGFNLIPALPMDGGRILRASLRAHHSYLQATIQAARIARFAAFGMFMAAFFSYDYWLVLIAFFVVLASNQEVQEAIAREQKKASPEDPPPPPVPPT
jgi:Zn-dependent protease